MSPGATMERVYLDLKARIMAGEFPPGARLDPAQLSRSLAASATPVRDALHRLSGERIIDSWHQEGFRQPILAEADIHDLYAWTAALLDLALRGAPREPAALTAPPRSDSEGYDRDIARLLRALAMLSDNHELRLAVGNAVDRSAIFRAAELRVDPAVVEAVAAMDEDLRFGRVGALRAKVTRFHRRRASFTGRVVAELRPRSQPLG